MANFEKYHFKGQEEGEVILSIIRRHWFNILMSFMPIIFSLFLWLFLIFLLPIAIPFLFQDFLFVFLFAMSFFLIFLWLSASFIWVDVYLDIWVLTNRRIVNIEQKGMFVREVSELHYGKVQDVTTEVKGILPTFLNYGNVLIQSAGTRAHFIFQEVPNPYQIKNTIVEFQKTVHKKEINQLREVLQEDMSSGV